MSKVGQSGIAHLGLILILLIGVGLGTYLVQQNTQFFSRADSETDNSNSSDQVSGGEDQSQEVSIDEVTSGSPQATVNTGTSAESVQAARNAEAVDKANWEEAQRSGTLQEAATALAAYEAAQQNTRSAEAAFNAAVGAVLSSNPTIDQVDQISGYISNLNAYSSVDRVASLVAVASSVGSFSRQDIINAAFSEALDQKISTTQFGEALKALPGVTEAEIRIAQGNLFVASTTREATDARAKALEEEGQKVPAGAVAAPAPPPAPVAPAAQQPPQQSTTDAIPATNVQVGASKVETITYADGTKSTWTTTTTEGDFKIGGGLHYSVTVSSNDRGETKTQIEAQSQLGRESVTLEGERSITTFGDLKNAFWDGGKLAPKVGFEQPDR